MNALPAPLTPPDCDLRNFSFMPLDVRRFRDSDLVAFEEPEAVLAAVMLWGAAWHSVPAASLTDDDRALAQLAGYGRTVKEFRRVKAGALRGFIKCSDGRLYHPVIAEKALEAWTGKLQQGYRTELARIRKHNERNPDDRLENPTFDQWLAGRKGIAARQGSLALVAPDVTGDDCNSHANVARDIQSKGKGEGKGQGEGQGQGDSRNTSQPTARADAGSADDASKFDLLGVTSRIANAAGVSIIRPTAVAKAMDIVKAWLADGLDLDATILPVIAERLADMKPNETVGSLAFFDAAVRKRHALAKPKPRKPSGPPIALKVRDSEDDRVQPFRDALLKSIGSDRYAAWVAPDKAAVVVNGQSVTIVAATTFTADWIRSNLKDTLSDEAMIFFDFDDVRITAQ